MIERMNSIIVFVGTPVLFLLGKVRGHLWPLIKRKNGKDGTTWVYGANQPNVQRMSTFHTDSDPSNMGVDRERIHP
jgi:hypothetical protein